MNIFSFAIFCYSAALLAILPKEPPSNDKIVIDKSLNTTEIHADGPKIFEWNDFHVAPNEIIRFVQKQKDDRIIIKVTSASATEILGSLESNCPIYFVNPAGFFIGNTATIDAEDFIASTILIEDEDFQKQDFIRSQKTSDGKIINLGSVQTKNGNIAMIARAIDNQGTIAAPLGAAVLLALSPVSEPQFPNESIQNSGIIEAASIKLKIDSPCEQAIFSNDVLQTQKATPPSSSIQITPQHGKCIIDGRLIAPAGCIEIDAKTVYLNSKAELNVSSQKCSGQIQIANSYTLDVDQGAKFLANTTEQGDGGTIFLAAKENLIFLGHAQACGGNRGGNGGTIHLCSEGSLFRIDPSTASFEASAPQGHPGMVIFDPKFVVISSEGTDPAEGNTFDSNPTGSTVISPLALESALSSANLTIQANTDILLMSPVDSSSNHSLTLQAGRSIQLFNNVTLNGGDFIAIINDGSAIISDRDPGVASFRLNDLARVSTLGGDITVDVGDFGGIQEGEVRFTRAALNAGGGNIAITGFGGQDGRDEAFGIILGEQSVIQTSAAGTIVLRGTGGNGANYNGGIYLDKGSLITESGLLQLIGVGGGNGGGIICGGIFSSAMIQSTNNGSILFQGSAGNGAHRNIGVWLYGGQVQAVDGNISLEGTGQGTGDMNYGIRLGVNSQCTISGMGSIALTGESLMGINNNHGTSLSNSTLTTSSGGISITGSSNGSLNCNYGIRLENASSCIVAGTQGISLTGQNNGGSTLNSGVSISTSGIAIASGYGNIQITGTSNGMDSLNQGVQVESGQIASTGTGPSAATIHLTGTGSYGADYCNGVAIIGSTTALTSIDGNITLEGTSHGSGQGNDPITVDPASHLECTGDGMVIYVAP